MPLGSCWHDSCLASLTGTGRCLAEAMEVLVRNLDEFYDLSLVFIQRFFWYVRVPGRPKADAAPGPGRIVRPVVDAA